MGADEEASEGAVMLIEAEAPIDRKRRESLSRQTYVALREGIILGRYPQGSRLAEQRLAEELEISRVPLREAMPPLETEGFVRTVPRRGSIVITWDKARVNDLFDLRLCLEVGAARYAARQVAGGMSMEPLDKALQHSHEVVHEGDPYKIAQASTWYHEAVVELTVNDLM